jgi:hypothetical protein
MIALAARLWDPASPGMAVSSKGVTLDVRVWGSARRARSRQPLVERWTTGAEEADLHLSDQLSVHIDCARGRTSARVSARLLADDPALVARLALETPAGAMLARRGYAVVHAGAVVGPDGCAVVIRGAHGAGKSTLVAAAHRAGLGVLCDEAVLVARTDPDEILAAVRDLTLLPDSADLLHLDDTGASGGGGATGAKLRVDLFRSSAPAARRARRVATIVLGPRDGEGAGLESLEPDAFLLEFQRGAIEQEQWSGTPDDIAIAWSRRGAYRLSGTRDLEGAVDLLAGLVNAGPTIARSAVPAR